MWNQDSVAATSIVTTWLDGERCTRPYTDRAKRDAYVEWAEQAGRQPAVEAVCSVHKSSIVSATKYDGVWYGECDVCVEARNTGTARRAADRRRLQSDAIRRYSGRVGRYGS